MAEVTKMVDMALSPQEAMESAMPMSMANAPRYPYGLSICLCQDELEKLGIDFDSIERGDILHLHALAKVTSTSESDTQGGETKRVEMQIMFLEIESEDEEKIEVNRSSASRRSKLYAE